RLDGVRLELPPLRDRLDDVALLIADLLARLALDRPEVALAPDAAHALLTYHWPLNVRARACARGRAGAGARTGHHARRPAARHRRSLRRGGPGPALGGRRAPARPADRGARLLPRQPRRGRARDGQAPDEDPALDRALWPRREPVPRRLIGSRRRDQVDAAQREPGLRQDVGEAVRCRLIVGRRHRPEVPARLARDRLA